MQNFGRRQFLKTLMATGAAATAANPAFVKAVSKKKIGANDTVNVAVVGIRGKGAQHINVFHDLDKVKVAAICDVDKEILDREESKFSKRNEKVKTYIDYRKLLDNKDIDAVVIATPNHQHSLMAIWACQAGKHVYVEKPVSHNVWEGRKVVEASRKYDRIVQAGTQKRSDEGLQEAFKYIQEGNLGKIQVAYGLCYKRRKSIGKVAGPQPISQNIDYNLWTGPAPLTPLRREQLHYDWHWQWATGNGDIGNQGIHEMDLCRWALGEKGFPNKVMSFGGRFGYDDDDGETPNTQVAIYEYDDAPIIFEVAGLPRRKNDTSMDNYKGIRIGVVIECENGYFAGGDGGGWIYDNNGVKIKQFKGDGGGLHATNFIKAVHSGKRADLNADIEEGHISSALCHLGNISYRLGQTVLPDQITQSIDSVKKALDSYKRFENHLFMNWVDINITKATVGPWLEIDKKKESFISRDEYDLARWANDLLSREYREPFVVPEKV